MIARRTRPLAAHSLRTLAAAFTLIELMVVIAIILLMVGIMSPSVTEFLKNRKIEFIRRETVSAFQRARLKAVNEGSRASVVFFRDGIRVFDERRREFADEFFEPGNSPLAKGEAWFVLGFLGDRVSTTLPTYYEWEDKWKAIAAQPARGESGAAAAARAQGPILTGLPKVIFERDGSLRFETGSDVSSAFYDEATPQKADIVIYQRGNNTACFVDLRPTGQIRTKLVVMAETPTEPKAEAAKAPSASGRGRRGGTE